MIIASPTDNRKVLAIFNNTQLEGPDEEVNWILSLIRQADQKSIRRSAQIKDKPN